MKILLTFCCALVLHAQSAPGFQVLTGLDVLARQHFAPLWSKHVGLISNHTGISADGKRNVDLMLQSDVPVTALFSPEHGFAGVEDQPNVANSVDPATSLPIYSLHAGQQHRLTPEMLKNVDTLVFDIQDVGARFYTYSCTMIYSMQEAARLHLSFYVLDRPNPITGDHVEGPVIDSDLESYVGCAPIPIRHGLTFGELAQFVNTELHIGADLHVIRMVNWHRDEWWDSTDFTWVDPSPNMNSLPAALLYPGLCLLEQTKNFSVGRGTRVAYEQIGADWLNGPQLAAFLNQRAIPGVTAYPTRFRPTAYHFANQTIPGVRFVVTDRNAFHSVRLGLEVIYAIQKLYPGKIDIDINRRLIGSKSVIASLQAGRDPVEIEKSYAAPLQQFLQTREKYLLYPR